MDEAASAFDQAHVECRDWKLHLFISLSKICAGVDQHLYHHTMPVLHGHVAWRIACKEEESNKGHRDYSKQRRASQLFKTDFRACLAVRK
jgi:hypothetical protein